MPRKKVTQTDDEIADYTPPKPKRRARKKKKEDEAVVDTTAALEQAYFQEATGDELKEIRQYNSTRWGAYTDKGVICGPTRAEALAKAIAHHKALKSD